MQPISFEEILEHILSREKRYPRDAYIFLKEALEHTQKQLGKAARGTAVQHVNPTQLLEGIREFALRAFGPMVTTVFEEWNIRSCKDFGEIVFIMIEHSLLTKTERESREDFEKGYDFYEAFRKPYLPKSKIEAEDAERATKLPKE